MEEAERDNERSSNIIKINSKDIDITKLPFRKGVIAYIINSKNEFLLTQNMSYNNNEWTFPGGGIEEDELPQTAMLRELEEELGTNKFKIIGQSRNDLKYYFPLEKIIYNFKNRESDRHNQGQIKNQFLVKFEGDESEIKLLKKELKDYKFAKFSDFKKHLIFPGQFDNARDTILDFIDQGLLDSSINDT